ncbi:hypothetical protein Tco_0039838 [Tanacetum coccineum]
MATTRIVKDVSPHEFVTRLCRSSQTIWQGVVLMFLRYETMFVVILETMKVFKGILKGISDSVSHHSNLMKKVYAKEKKWVFKRSIEGEWQATITMENGKPESGEYLGTSISALELTGSSHSKTSSPCTKKPRSPSVPLLFSFRSDERAAKRKEVRATPKSGVDEHASNSSSSEEDYIAACIERSTLTACAGSTSEHSEQSASPWLLARFECMETMEYSSQRHTPKTRVGAYS